jgi:hypothetical protein
MTVLHIKKQPHDLVGLHSESQCCIDCGYNTNPGSPPRALAEYLLEHGGEIPITITAESENYIVKESIWKAAGMEPYGGCLCIGCLENRLGRRLKPKDFPHNHPFNNPGMPCTDRLRNRRGHE